MRQADLGRSWPLFLFLILFSFLLLLAEQVGIITPLRGAIEKITVPIQSVVYRTQQKLVSPTPISVREQKIASLEAQIAILREENEQLRRLLGVPLPSSWKFLPSRVVGLAEEMVIDEGQASGVTPGMVVISEEIFVGLVSSVTPEVARVRLPAHPESKIPVEVVTEEGLRTAKGLLVGQEGKVRLTRVLQKEDLAQGYLVMTSGEAGYPAGLAIGRITSVSGEKREPYQEAEVETLISYSQLTTVFVVIGR